MSEKCGKYAIKHCRLMSDCLLENPANKSQLADTVLGIQHAQAFGGISATAELLVYH